jgi:hypothetical protein
MKCLVQRVLHQFVTADLEGAEDPPRLVKELAARADVCG